MVLNNTELNDINGGSWGGFIFCIGALIVFAIGVVDGYIRPKSCK